MRNVYNLSIRAWLLSLLCLLVGGRAVANEPQHPKPTNDYITVNDVTLVPGSTDTYQVEISLEGVDSQIYTAYQMDILFPPGVDVVVGEYGPYVRLWKGDGCIYPKRWDEFFHHVETSYGVVSNKLLRISCRGDMNMELTATSGKLLYFLVKVTPYLKPGDVILKVTNFDLITKENAQKYHCKDQTLTLHATAESTATLSVSGSSHYGTCVLPFAVSSLPTDVKAYSAKGLDDTGQLVVLDEVTQLAAYTPYILYSESGYSGSLSGTVDANKYGEVVSDGLLRGAIAPQKRKDGYVLQDLGEGAKFLCHGWRGISHPRGQVLARDARRASLCPAVWHTDRRHHGHHRPHHVCLRPWQDIHPRWQGGEDHAARRHLCGERKESIENKITN